jgi:hypothetical protein
MDLNLIYHKYSKSLWSVIDLLAALALIVLVNGLKYPNNDATNLITLTYKLQNPNLFPNDITFSASPLGYSAFFIWYLNILSNFLSYRWAMILSNLFSQLLLLFALRRLAKQITTREIPAISFSLLILGLGAVDLIAGYQFTSPYYSSHYTAFAFVLLGISYYLSQQKWFSGVFFVLSILFNIRIGFLGVGFLFLVWFWERPNKLKFRILPIIVIGFLFSLGFLIWFNYQPSKNALDEIIRIWIFFRAPAHYLPYLDPYKIVNVLLISIFIALMWRKQVTQTGKAMCFAALVYSGGIFVNIINNSTILDPIILLLQIWECGFLIISVFYILICQLLAERIDRGLILSSIIVLLVSDYQMRSIILLSILIIDPFLNKIWSEKKLLKDGIVSIISILTIFLLSKVIPRDWLQNSFTSIPNNWWFILGISGLFIILARKYTYQKVIISTFVGCFAAALITGTYVGIMQGSFNTDLSWDEVANFAIHETPIDATFIINPQISNFQVISQRSTFASYKHFPAYDISQIPEWFNRMKMLHVVPDISPNKINQIVKIDWNKYNNLSTNDFLQIKKHYDFVDYAIVKADVNLELPLVFHNKKYKIYSLMQNQ